MSTQAITIENMDPAVLRACEQRMVELINDGSLAMELKRVEEEFHDPGLRFEVWWVAQAKHFSFAAQGRTLGKAITAYYDMLLQRIYLHVGCEQIDMANMEEPFPERLRLPDGWAHAQANHNAICFDLWHHCTLDDGHFGACVLACGDEIIGHNLDHCQLPNKHKGNCE